MNKRKIALFVEGQGELIFLREFLFRWYQFDTNRVGVTCYSLQAQRFNPVPYPIGDEQSENFFQIGKIGVCCHSGLAERNAEYHDNFIFYRD